MTQLFALAQSTSFFLDRQYLVNVRQSREIFRTEPRAVVLRLKSGREVPGSRRYFAASKQRLGIRSDLKYVDPFRDDPFTASKGPFAPAYAPLSDLISRSDWFSSMRLRAHAGAKAPARERTAGSQTCPKYSMGGRFLGRSKHSLQHEAVPQKRG
jgi:hypothetical protein